MECQWPCWWWVWCWLLLVVSLRRGLSGLFDRAWWTAVLVLVVLHATDLPFFDSRLNIAGWILLAGITQRDCKL